MNTLPSKIGKKFSITVVIKNEEWHENLPLSLNTQKILNLQSQKDKCKIIIMLIYVSSVVIWYAIAGCMTWKYISNHCTPAMFSSVSA